MVALAVVLVVSLFYIYKLKKNIDMLEYQVSGETCSSMKRERERDRDRERGIHLTMGNLKGER